MVMVEVDDESAWVNGAPPPWALVVVRHAGWREKAALGAICREWRAALAQDARGLYWQQLAACLQEERGVYAPAGGRAGERRVEAEAASAEAENWREAFFRGWRKRGRFLAAEARGGAANEAAEHVETAFSIRVCARFRPPRARTAAEGAPPRKVVLPLHQRLTLIRTRDSSCSRSDALRKLWQEEGRAADSEAGPWREQAVVPESPPGEADEADAADFASTREEESAAAPTMSETSFTASVLNVDEETGSVLTIAPSVGMRQFAFDSALGEESTQEQAYRALASGIVAEFVNGNDGCIFAYGQTGSGKTHSMIGPESALSSCKSRREDGDQRGVVPRALEDILEAMAWRQEWRRAHGLEPDGAVKLSAAYVEIYGDEVTDLLHGGRPVGQNKAAAHRYVLDGSANQQIASLKDAYHLLRRGLSQRRVAATRMNERSSRAHALLVLTLEQSDASATGIDAPSTPTPLMSRLILADLGGSENVSKSGAADGLKAAGNEDWQGYYASRVRFNEAVQINASLLALKSVVGALNQRTALTEQGEAALAETVHVPYADSKLTLILSAALAGGTMCAVMVTATAEPVHIQETLATLRFGEATAAVCNRASELSDAAKAALRAALARVDADIASAEEEIEKRETWATREVRRVDELSGKIEMLRVTAPVGAERARERLETLLAKRRELLGQAV